jgi:tRNA threonylcarbamoyladenosine biosynthesis protein TsaE
MSTGLTQEINSTSLSDTLALASQIGSRLKGGEVIELVSDLGGGKTAFVRGLVEGVGSEDRVSSPSFTLSNQYTGNGLTVYHFDFYRLDKPGILEQELEEILEDSQAVVVIEWAGIVNASLPDKRLTINIIPTGEDERRIILEYTSTLSYLFADNT